MGARSDVTLFCLDIPKFLTNHTVYYSWEGNPVNISCDVMSNPPATMLWRRERFTISTEGTANMRVHSAEGKSVLEVSSSPPVAARLGLGSREKKCV